MRNQDKIQECEKLDQLIKAQLPDPKDPRQKRLYDIVSAQLIHRPCGILNPNSVCMENNQCTKEFPKKFTSETQMNVNGYPLYARPDNGNYIKKITIQKK